MTERTIGSTWLKEYFKLSNIKLSHQSYLGSRSKIEILQDGSVKETFQMNYVLKEETPLRHFEFALKYDDIQLNFFLCVLKTIPVKDIIEFIESAPNFKYSRKIGFWYEFLTGKHLPLDDRANYNYVDLIDSNLYFTGKIIKNGRWRINNNLLGNFNFCPIIKKTDVIIKALNIDFSALLVEISNRYSPEIVNRAINYLYKKETRSSYQIEKVELSPERIERFVTLLSNAGKSDIGELLSEESLTKLLNQIVDPRFAASGFRNYQNYIGQTAWNYEEIIHYVCPPPQFISSLVQGISDAALKSDGIHPIVRAVVVAFGFVFIHPFENGNGRIHRFLIHDILSRDNFIPAGMIIPVSAHMVNNMKAYDDALEAYSKPLLNLIRYAKNEKKELLILNASDVEGYYRFPDLTVQTEYLCKVIETSVTNDLPKELVFLQNYDEARELMKQKVDMPDRLIDAFIRFTHQNNGTFPKRRRKDFNMLEDDEIEALQTIFKSVFIEENL